MPISDGPLTFPTVANARRRRLAWRKPRVIPRQAPILDEWVRLRNFNRLSGIRLICTALRCDPGAMLESLAGMMAATAGGRPITSGRISSTKNAMPDRSAGNYVSYARVTPNSSMSKPLAVSRWKTCGAMAFPTCAELSQLVEPSAKPGSLVKVCLGQSRLRRPSVQCELPGSLAPPVGLRDAHSALVHSLLLDGRAKKGGKSMSGLT
jgi:hypothetical protein